MREILEEAAIVCRQEVEDLLLIAAPAAVAGPILVLISTAGFTAAVVCIPIVLAIYLIVYAATVQASALMLRNMAPDPAEAYLAPLGSAVDIVRTTGPGLLFVAVLWGLALGVSNQGFSEVAFVLGIAGAAAVFVWAARHAFDLPLILVHGLDATDAQRFGAQFVGEDAIPRSLSFCGGVASPLLVAGLLSVALGLMNPVFGAALFAAAFALWLPFGSLALSMACDRMVDDTVAASQQQPASAAR